MQQDQWGHSLTTENTESVEALDQALNSYIGWRTDASQHANAAIAADPEFALAHVVKGILVSGLRKSELNHLVSAELEAAHKGRLPSTARERHYIEALEASQSGRITEAASHFEQIASAHPHDLFALRLAQFELFWIGEVEWMRDISERAAPMWSADQQNYPAFLSIRAFGLEETGDYELAERCGREAVERDPTDCWGAHAVAHVLIMQGRLADGITWLGELNNNWAEANHIVHHLWWHLALFRAENREYDGALELYDTRLRNLDSPLMQAIPDFYVDIQNDVALLQRLELRGVDVGDRWQPIGELARARIGNHSSPFTSAHCALALAAAGLEQDAQELITQMHAFVAADRGALGPRYALAVLPAAEAAIAYRKADYQRVLDLLLPARRNLWQMGGSHAQRDLFFQLLADAALKLGKREFLTLLLKEIKGIGFDHIEERSSYADTLATLAS
ncbi:MAG: tetratricopeptide repeat protein [Arenicellales bacterium]|nr:tetratricopeptide repeat protein [Arenicellales bacterium]